MIDSLRPSKEQVRDLPSFKTERLIHDGRQSLPTLDPISRPSSTSTQNSSLHHSASLPQLPGLATLASIASSSASPQLRYVWNIGPHRNGIRRSGWLCLSNIQAVRGWLCQRNILGLEQPLHKSRLPQRLVSARAGIAVSW